MCAAAPGGLFASASSLCAVLPPAPAVLGGLPASAAPTDLLASALSAFWRNGLCGGATAGRFSNGGKHLAYLGRCEEADSHQRQAESADQVQGCTGQGCENRRRKSQKRRHRGPNPSTDYGVEGLLTERGRLLVQSLPAPAMPNGRCRMRGGKSPGAPKGNRNAWKHGLYSAESIELRRLIRRLLSGAAELAERC